MSPFTLSASCRGFLASLAFALVLSASFASVPGAPPWGSPPLVPGNAQMTVNWLGATGSPTPTYQIRYRASASNDSWITIPSIGSAVRTYVVKGPTNPLANQESYEFQVGATNVNGTTWSLTVQHGRPHDKLHTSGMHAGGQINAIVRAGSGVMIAGTDVGGFQRSLDKGATWQQASVGVAIGTAQHAVAALAYYTTGGKVYGYCGGSGTGNIFVSTDNGANWTLKHSGADIVAEANSATYPRKVGRLIIVDQATGDLYIGTDGAGLKKSTAASGGAVWISIAPTISSAHVNGIALDSGFIYASVGSGTTVTPGVYRCDLATGTVTTHFDSTSSPTTPEELLILGNKLYLANRNHGVLRLDNASYAGHNATWTDLGITAGGDWCAIDGYIDAGSHVLVVGNSNATESTNSDRYTTVMKCTSAQTSPSWTDLSSDTNIIVNEEMIAGNAEKYWRVDETKGRHAGNDWKIQKRLDGDAFNIDQISIDPADHDNIHIVGQMCIWRSWRDVNNKLNWSPAVIGLSNAVLNCVAVDPNQAGHVFVGDSDNCLWASEDYGATMAYISVPSDPSHPSVGKPPIWALAVDENSVVYTGFLSSPGGVWSYTPSTDTWDVLADTSGHSLDYYTGNTVHGVAVQHLTNRVVLAAVENSGLWRLAQTTWKKSTTGPTLSSLGAVKTMPFAWSTSNKQIVYFYDQQTGLWRSDNSGQDWGAGPIWNQGFTQQLAGSIALVNGAPSPLYLTNDTGLYRIDHADGVGGSPTPHLLTGAFANPGKLTAVGTNLWFTCYEDSSGTSNVAVGKYSGSAFSIFTSPYYQGAMGRATGIAADADHQYITGGPLGISIHDN